MVIDFAMNTVCAAGTGSFLDHQAERLGIPIEHFGELALTAERDVRIAGRCTVFAESDMIAKQQYGFSKAEIIKGLCSALVRNYINNLSRGKTLKPPYVFQGGVAANIGIRKAFEAGEINYDKVQNIMAEEKPNQKPKFKFSFDRLKPYIPKDYNDRMAEDYVIKALEHYQKFLRKQREQAR